MSSNRRHKIDAEIADLLMLTAAHSCEHQTLWMDDEAITWMVLDTHTRGARRLIRQRLRYLLSLGVVEQREFNGWVGWRLIGSATVISD